MSAPAIPLRIRKLVWARSEGFCEACGGHGAVHIHHRKLRSQGGKHEPANLLHLHVRCHDAIHAHPTRSYELGLLVRATGDPELIPVVQFPPSLLVEPEAVDA